MKALKDVKIADFSWILAAPLATKCLADHGATVIRIESNSRPDVARMSAPYRDRVPGINRGGMFTFQNSNKYDLALNLRHPKASRVVKKLVGWCDAVVENFAPGTMESLGLGYDDLKQIKPNVIMLRATSLGQTGPYAKDSVLGIHLTGLSGFTNATGWPDRAPVQPFGAYTDATAAIFGTIALLEALDYYRKTGKGQCIDISQFEASLQFLAPGLLEYTVNKHELARTGNRCASAAPHNAYRCAGDDQWCVIGVTNDNEWDAFCRVIGNPGLVSNPKFSTMIARKQNEDELDVMAEDWTLKHTSKEVMTIMQTAGVPAGIVETSKDLLEDPQLENRQYFWRLNHPEMGTFPHAGQPFILSKTPAEPKMPSPCLGEHTEYVCREILGMSDSEFVSLLNEAVFE